jgi:hypothetical protein
MDSTGSLPDNPSWSIFADAGDRNGIVLRDLPGITDMLRRLTFGEVSVLMAFVRIRLPSLRLFHEGYDGVHSADVDERQSDLPLSKRAPLTGRWGNCVH